MAASPICTVKDGAGAPVSTTNGVNCTAGNTITIALVSSAGVSSWSITCIGTDELQVAATINAGLTVDGVNKTATFTMPANGTALGFRSTVTDSNGVAVSTQFGVYTLISSLRVGFVGETTEGSSAFGYTATLNAKIRQAAGGGSSLPTLTSRKVKSANYTIVSSTDYLIECRGASGFTITLPAAPADTETYIIKNNISAGGNNTVGGGGHSIDGSANYTLAPGSAITVVYDLTNTDWVVI